METQNSIERIASLTGFSVREATNPATGQPEPAFVSASGELPTLFDARSFGERGAIMDRGVARATSQYGAATGIVDHLITEIVAGQVGMREDWVNAVFPRIVPTDEGSGDPIGGSTFKYLRFGSQHLEEKNVKLGPRAPYGFVDFDYAELSSQIELYGVASFADRRALRDAPAALRLAIRTELLCSRIISMALKADAKRVMTDTTTASYTTGHVTTIGGGNEWSVAAKDPRTTVQPLVNKILAAVGGDPTNIVGFIPLNTYQVLRDNTVYQAAFSSVIAPSADMNANLQRMADFLGIGRMVMLNDRLSSAGTVSAMFGDDLFLKHDGFTPNAGWTTDYGAEQGAVRFALNDGVAEQPWEDRLTRTQIFAFNREWKLEPINTAAWALVRNTNGE